MNDQVKEKAFYGLSEEERKKIEEAYAKIREQWQQKRIPQRIAKCVVMAQDIERIDFLPSGIEMFCNCSGIFKEIFFELVPFNYEDEVGYKAIKNYLRKQFRDASGDFISCYCKEFDCSKKQRDGLIRFYRILESLLRRDGVVRDMPSIMNSMKEILITIREELWGKTSVFQYYLYNGQDSLLNDTLKEMETLGCDPINNGFEEFKAMLGVVS